MRPATSFKVVCPVCIVQFGIVHEVEDKTRIGFFTNQSVPEDLPTRCPECKGNTVRVSN